MSRRATLLLTLLFANFASPQYSGDFWWLNDKVKALHGKEAPPVQFEKLTGYETDESDKIIFKSFTLSNEIIKKEHESEKKENRTGSFPLVSLHFPDWNKFFLSSGSKQDQTKITKTSLKRNISSTSDRHDEFSIKFPNEDNFIWLSHHIETSSELNNSTGPKLQNIVFPTEPQTDQTLENTDKLSFSEYEQRDNKTESICSYLPEQECKHLNGSVYKTFKRSQLNYDVCCILPLEGRLKSEIKFPEETIHSKRSARSTDEKQKSLNQRTAVQNNFNKRIVTPEEDDYEDPYENIKNYGQRTPNAKVPYQALPPDYVDDEEYVDELPTPSLVGLYSDPGKKTASLPFTPNNGEIVLVANDFGYRRPTLDPRLDNRVAVLTNRPVRRKATKRSFHPKLEKGVEIISYQSKPDFKVLQGFKLLNLVQNKGLIKNKLSKLQTGGPELDDTYSYSEEDSVEKQDYEDCGIVDDEISEDYIYEDSQDEEVRSVPWAALVARGRAGRHGPCSAALVHPRAAVTAASCVFGSSAGDVVVSAGGWDSSSQAQRRTASVYFHPRFTGDSFNDIALLYWRRPLKMGDSAKAICLDDPQPGETCQLVGLGDDARQPLQQRARILQPRECAAPLPGRSFCTTVDGNFAVSPGAVLQCSRGGRWAAVGVAARRRDVTKILLTPVREWTQEALDDLGIV